MGIIPNQIVWTVLREKIISGKEQYKTKKELSPRGACDCLSESGAGDVQKSHGAEGEKEVTER